MQIKKNKFLIGTLLSIASIGVVGSITGTYAWYTYNTKDNLMYSGIAVADSENLEFRLKTKTGYTDWTTTIKTEELVEVAEENGFAGEKLGVVSFKTKQLANRKLNKFYAAFDPFRVKADAVEDTLLEDENLPYLQAVIQFRCTQVGDTKTNIGRNVYLSRCNVKATTEGKDISKALRVHFDRGGLTEDDKSLIAPAYAKTDTKTIDLYGAYDMNGDGALDYGIATSETPTTGEYIPSLDPTEEGRVKLIYGEEGAEGSKNTETFFAKDDVLAQFKGGKLVSGTGRVIMKTAAFVTEEEPEDDQYNSVTMTIFIDGWDAACKNANANCGFDLDLSFQCEKGSN